MTRDDDKSRERGTRSNAEGGAEVDDNSRERGTRSTAEGGPSRPDPFAPLPLPETLTGSTKTPKRDSAPVSAPPAPASPPPAPPPPAPPPPALVASELPPEPAPELPPPAPLEPAAYTAPAPLPVEPAWSEAPASPIVVENELRDAVGATLLPEDKQAKKKPDKRKRAATQDDDEDDRPRGNRLWMLAAALAIVIGGGITAMILVGRANSEHYYFVCEAKRVVIQQGRSFPPWGRTELGGAEWKAFEIPADAACVSFETESKAALAEGFVKLLEDRATKLVGGRGGQSTAIAAIDPEDPVAKVDEAEASLQQALLVTRHLVGDAAINKRDKLKHLLGDVTYWRAAARLRAAATALDEAAKQFDTAALQQPNANTDPGEWAALARKLADELRAGPKGLTAADIVAPAPTSEQPAKPPAPIGTALPVEPPSAGSAAEPAPTPDAGVPVSSGGVLL